MINNEFISELKGKNCLVTGGAGSLGSYLVAELLRLGAQVVVLDDLSSGRLDNINHSSPNLTFIKGSVTSQEDLDKAFSKSISYVFHLAAHFANQNSVEHPYEDLMTNAAGTVLLLNMCRNIPSLKRILYASSSCVLGPQDGILKEESEVMPETPYGFSKLAGEEYSLFYSLEFNLPVTVIRYFNSYGPGEYPGKYRNVIPNFIDLALKNEPLTITGTGEETREFVYVSDTITGTLQASVDDNSLGKVFHLGSGQRVSINNLATMILDICDSKSKIKYLPKRSWDHILHRETSIKKAQSTFNYSPEVALEEGLVLMVEWMKKNAGPY